MTCEEVRGLYAHAQVPPATRATRAAVAAHLVWCGWCRTFAREVCERRTYGQWEPLWSEADLIDPEFVSVVATATEAPF